MRRFTPEEDLFIRENILELNIMQMGKLLNRHFSSIYGRMKCLGLKIPEDIKKKRRDEALSQAYKNISTQFKKGQTPWNKGKKGICLGGQLTQFQKGHLPHNTKFNGAIRLDINGYLSERIELGKWEFKHRLVWEQANGAIPEGMCIRFIDGNKLNVNIENLCLVDRVENMNLNTIHRYSPDVKKAIRTLSKLKRTIKKKHNEQAN